MKGLYLCVLVFFSIVKLLQATDHGDYPAEWWAPADPTTAPAWEILPQAAAEGEVILSKRTELGIFSNFAATPFVFEEKSYASLEGFWQMMKFPDDMLSADPRSQYPWSTTREAVSQMTGFEAKDAGNEGSQVMKNLAINWVTYKGEQIPYRVLEKARHYDLILAATREKLAQTEGLKELLLKTGTLQLKPDHHQGEDTPPAWKYYEIWMLLRSELRH